MMYYFRSLQWNVIHGVCAYTVHWRGKDTCLDLGNSLQIFEFIIEK